MAISQEDYYLPISMALGGQESNLEDMYPGQENKKEDLNFCKMGTTLPRSQ